MIYQYVDNRISVFRSFCSWCMSIRDKRVDGWPLMDSFTWTLLIVMSYLLMVRLGPRAMKSRQPFQLKGPIIVYNLSIASLNLYMGVEIFSIVWTEGYSWLCEPVDQSLHPSALRVVSVLWFYYTSKMLEFFDSFFFVVRKKDNQLSFLHVYHHSTMFTLWWIGVRWVPGGSGAIGAMMNSFVHTIMYSYYGLAAMGPAMKKFLWWKKYITMLQMVQFFVSLAMGANALRMECPFPLWMQYTNLVYMVTFIVLFTNFYVHTYKLKRDVIKSGVHRNGYANGCATNGHAVPVASANHHASVDQQRQGKTL